MYIFDMDGNKHEQPLKEEITILPINAIMAYDWGSSDPDSLINQLTGKKYKRCA